MPDFLVHALTFVVGLVVGGITNYALISGRIATLEANDHNLSRALDTMKEDFRREIASGLAAVTARAAQAGYDAARSAVHRD